MYDGLDRAICRHQSATCLPDGMKGQVLQSQNRWCWQVEGWWKLHELNNLQLHDFMIVQSFLGVMLSIIVEINIMLVCGGWTWEITPFNLVMPWCNFPPLHGYVPIDVITVFVTEMVCLVFVMISFTCDELKKILKRLNLPSNTPETSSSPCYRNSGLFSSKGRNSVVFELPQEMLEVILGELKQPRQRSADGQSFHLQKDGWQASLDEKVERGSPYGAMCMNRMQMRKFWQRRVRAIEWLQVWTCIKSG